MLGVATENKEMEATGNWRTYHCVDRARGERRTDPSSPM